MGSEDSGDFRGPGLTLGSGTLLTRPTRPIPWEGERCCSRSGEMPLPTWCLNPPPLLLGLSPGDTPPPTIDTLTNSSELSEGELPPGDRRPSFFRCRDPTPTLGGSFPGRTRGVKNLDILNWNRDGGGGMGGERREPAGKPSLHPLRSTTRSTSR